jgi:hypothetical protein
MKHKNNIWVNIKLNIEKVTKIALIKRNKTNQRNKLNIYLHISVHTHNIQIAQWIHNKTVHLQLLSTPLIVGTTGRSTRGSSLIGNTILHILNAVPVRARRIGPTGGQRQVFVQQHGVHNRPAVRGQLRQFTIIGPSVDKTQRVVPSRIGSRQPFKGM